MLACWKTLRYVSPLRGSGIPRKPITGVGTLIITHILIQSKILTPLKSNENPAIFSPSPLLGERGPGG